MRIFHTADWHLGKLVQGVYMTEDQADVLDAFIEEIKKEQPDAVLIAGDLYDRAIPPTEAVTLLNQTLDEIVLKLNIPVLAIAGNHDSPSRLHFGSSMMQQQGFYIAGEMKQEIEEVILEDEAGDVHFHLVPYSDPAKVAYLFQDGSIKSHQQATEAIVEHIEQKKATNARHVYMGHAFVTPSGEVEENTSESERPLAIGGAEQVDAHLFAAFDYVALGHLHQAHYVLHHHIRYAGSLLKYSLSEAGHQKGYYVVDLAGDGEVNIEKRLFSPTRDLRHVEGLLADILRLERSDDYVFVTLLDETPVLSPMEKIRSVFPNAMHVERKLDAVLNNHQESGAISKSKQQLSQQELFEGFYKEIKGIEPDEKTEQIFQEVLADLLKEEQER